MLDRILQELKEKWGYDTAELNDIRYHMINFAMMCAQDSDVYNECANETIRRDAPNIIYHDFEGRDSSAL